MSETTESPSLLPWLAAPFARALALERASALLVHGPAGVGQFELALALAAAWLCETPLAERAEAPPGLACGHCASCRLIASRTHPDLLVLVPEVLQQALGWTGDEAETAGEGGSAKSAKPSKEIKVEALRRVVAFSQQTPARGGLDRRTKVVVIHPAERMNGITANTLLKTLEEPPGGLRFVLSSAAPARLLPTVRSRCHALPLTVPPGDQAAAWLGGQGIDAPAVLLAAAGGQPLEALDRHAIGVSTAAWRALPGEIRAGRAGAAADWPLPVLIDALAKLCDDALRVAVGAAPRFFEAELLPPGGDLDRLNAWATALREAARRAEHPWHAGLATEALVLQARHALYGDSTSQGGPRRRLATLDP
ncbi:DNA polymerase III subunit delta' [Rivibacter subsaxonicus]|uniref:DNA polymerase-3 subunit delta n=1 Tax=Rivibacter subsaxonicus TaxID=457575 RepID=A0A4Q7VAI4_9BURK|nr:DNA polymerase III subunit delta' [Rivibacter subsaxonicus]RZT93771.1 DNA polymerase-3 subunit delta' [Rivibacter subsaxonicus]